MSNNKRILTYVLITALVLLVIGLVWFMFASVSNSIRTAFQPLQQTSSGMSTEIANLLHPTPTVIPDPVTIIHEVRAIARLETIQYSVEKVITAEVNQGVLRPFLGDHLLFVGHGTVIAGIDMEKIQPEDLWVKGGVLHVRLPAAEILIATLDNEKSYVYDRQTGLLTHGDQNLETTARQVAEDEIRKAAISDGILNLAMQNAQTYLERFFRALGYAEVIFESPAP